MDPTTNDPNNNPASAVDDATNAVPPAVGPAPDDTSAQLTDSFGGDTTPADPAVVGSTVAPTEPVAAPAPEAPTMDLPAVDPNPSVDLGAAPVADPAPLGGVSTPADDTVASAPADPAATPDANQQLGSF